MTEWFEIITTSGQSVGYASRAKCHTCPSLLHRVVHVLVFNSRNDLYLQKRSRAKDIQPGKWDTSVGGHADPGESVAAAARREMREELGIAPDTLSFLYDYVWTSDCESELVSTFTCRFDGECRPDPIEIEQGCWWSATEIAAALPSGLFTPNFIEEYRRFTACIPSLDNTVPK